MKPSFNNNVPFSTGDWFEPISLITDGLGCQITLTGACQKKEKCGGEGDEEGGGEDLRSVFLNP